MNLQVIKSTIGKPEYVLLPIKVYRHLRQTIHHAMADDQQDFVAFDVADYVDNQVALTRIKAHLTQQQLAKLMGVSQAYISKIEHQTTVSGKMLAKVQAAIRGIEH